MYFNESSHHHFSTKVCPECGETFEEQAESYLNECDHCLSKITE